MNWDKQMDFLENLFAHISVLMNIKHDFNHSGNVIWTLFDEHVLHIDVSKIKSKPWAPKCISNPGQTQTRSAPTQDNSCNVKCKGKHRSGYSRAIISNRAQAKQNLIATQVNCISKPGQSGTRSAPRQDKHRQAAKCLGKLAFIGFTASSQPAASLTRLPTVSKNFSTSLIQ